MNPLMKEARHNRLHWPLALIPVLRASLVTHSRRSAWFVGVLIVNVYLVFAMTLYPLPPKVP